MLNARFGLSYVEAEMMKMHISINDELKETETTTLLELIKSLGLPSQGVAVAFDGEIVPKNSWEQFELKEGMALDIFNMVTGG